MREVFARFDAYLDADPPQQQELLAKLEREKPEIALHLRKLIVASSSEADGPLERPALEHVVTQERGAPENAFVDAAPPSFRSTARLWLKPRFRRVLLIGGLVSLLLFAWAGSLLVRLGDQVGYRAWDGDWNPRGAHVTKVDANGPAAGKLKVGDQLTAVNGVKEDVLPAFANLRVITRAGSYRVAGLRDGKPFEVMLRVGRQTVPSQAGNQFFVFLTGLLFFLTAMTIGFSKPDAKVTRLATLALITEAMVLLGEVTGSYSDLLGNSEAFLEDALTLVSGVHFALAYHFYAAFYDDLLGRTRRRWLIAVFYVWGIYNALAYELLFGHLRVSMLLRHPRACVAIYSSRRGFFVVGPLAILALVAVNHVRSRKLSNPGRSRWIAFGSLAGIAPYVTYSAVVFCLLFFRWNISEQALDLGLRVSILAAAAIPFCTAYAVLKHHIFDIRVILRAGLKYILLTRTLQVLLLLPVLGALISLFYNRERTVGEALGHNLGFLFLILLFSGMLLVRGSVQNWLNRHYGRDAASRARQREAAGKAIRKAASFNMLEAVATEQIHLLFDPTLLLICLDTNSNGLLATQQPSAAWPEGFVLQASGDLVSRVEQQGRPQHLTALQRGTGPNPELAQLQQAGVQIAVPAMSREGLAVAVILLGERRSQDRYSPADLDLLEAIAEDVAGIFESLRLEQHLQEQQSLSREAQVRLDAERSTYFLECPECGLCYDAPRDRCDRDHNPLLRNRFGARRIHGRYEIERRLEKGGMGTVYECRDLKLKRVVAIKIITAPDGVTAARWADRAVREGQALASLNHAHIVAAFDCGTNEQGSAYLVMEFLRGQTLRAVLRQGRVAPTLAAMWLDQMLQGLDCAHRAGIIHRDLKPENIMIVENAALEQGVKLLDFGIAKVIEDSQPEAVLTLTGMRVGTPFYMSPEQFDCKPIDPRSDLFAVGVIVLEMLNGELPLTSFSVPDRFLAWLHGKEVLPVSTENDLQLKKVLDACLAQEPEHRPQSAAELRRSLVPLVRNYRGSSEAAA